MLIHLVTSTKKALGVLTLAVLLTTLLAYRESPLGPSPVQAATIAVNTTSDAIADDGDCSLREAIINANDDADTHDDCPGVGAYGADTITFDLAPLATITMVGNSYNINGQLEIIGPGEADLTIVADANRVFDSNSGDHVISGLTVTGGNIPNGGGGGVYVSPLASLELTNITVTGNSVGYEGGGISVLGSATLTNVTVSINVASGAGDNFGGGIYVGEDGDVTLNSSTVSGNAADDDGGGIYNLGDLTVDGGSVIDSNGAVSGGGIYTEGAGASLSLAGASSVSGNTAAVNGGGIYTEGTPVTIDEGSNVNGNTAVSTSGGGILNSGGVLTILGGSSIYSNGAPGALNGAGGGIANFASGTTTLTDSTVRGNTSGLLGGGIANGSGSIVITRSTIGPDNSTSGNGGGLFENGGSATLVNSTVSGNDAASGGGIYVFASEVTLVNSTVTDNTGNSAGIVDEGFGDGTVFLSNTIVADNNGTNCTAINGNFVSNGFNLDSDGSCITGGVNNDITSLLANLGPLAFNGGPTQTHALLLGSDAIDNADDSVCDADPVNAIDQRGVARPQGAQCDIGAYETQATADAPQCALAPGQDLITERCLIIVKQTDPDGSPESFPFEANVSPPDTDFAFGLQDGQFAGFDLAITDTVYTVTELVPGGWELTGIDCDEDGIDFAVDLDNATLTVTFTGDQVGNFAYAVCTFSDLEEDEPDGSPTPSVTAPAPAQITISKQVIGGPGWKFSFESDFGAFSLAPGDSQTFDVDAGTYQVSENPAPGFQLLAIECDGGSVEIEANGVDIVVDTGESVECVFVNGKLTSDQPNVSGIFGGVVGKATPTPATVAPSSITPPNTGDAGLK